MTQTEIQTILQSHAIQHNCKMAMIGKNAHPCPVPDIAGRALFKVFKGHKVGVGSLAIIERFFTNLTKENHD